MLKDEIEEKKWQLKKDKKRLESTGLTYQTCDPSHDTKITL
jgi:hypothetical protein